MNLLLELAIIFGLTVVQSVFGFGLLLFGTPTFLLIGYDFANTINILMPVSILISSLQFKKSRVNNKIFIREYNIFCLPFLVIFLILALNYTLSIDFKFFVALLLIFSSLLILNKSKFSSLKAKFYQFKKLALIIIGSIHGFTNMGGSFLSIYSTLISKNKKEYARYYVSYGYLIMGLIQYFTVWLFSFDLLNFSKLYYMAIALLVYFPAQKIFLNINDKAYSKYINLIALLYGLIIISSYLINFK
tara:strand:- start:259 stop:996 length:738 start_codon:yes stop_codon:yes gene_type:complete